MRKYVRMILAVGLLALMLCLPAYAQIDVILTDSYPICIYDGEVPVCGFVPVDFEKGVYLPEAAAKHEQDQKRHDEWLQLCDNTYHEFCQLYTHPQSRDMNRFGEEMSAEELVEYVRENGQTLIDEGLLEPGQREVPRRSMGEIKDVEYTTVSRQYLIPLKDGKTAVLDTPDGYTFLGGTFEPVSYYDRAEKLAVMSGQSGWKALNFPNDPVCTVQRFCGNDETGYYHINELYSWGDLTDKQKKVENLLILPIEDCRGMMATATQNWALEQAIEQSQAKGFDKQWQEWVDWNEQYADSSAYAESEADIVIELPGFPIVVFQGETHSLNASHDTFSEEMEAFLARNTERFGAFYWKNYQPDQMHDGMTSAEYIAYLQSDVEALQQRILRGEYELGALWGDRTIKHAWECGILGEDVCGELDREELLACLTEISAGYEYPEPIETPDGVICVFTGNMWQFGSIGADESWEYSIWRSRMQAQFGEYYEVRYGYGLGYTHSNQEWELEELLAHLRQNGVE